jgi:hypothetical protein
MPRWSVGRRWGLVIAPLQPERRTWPRLRLNIKTDLVFQMGSTTAGAKPAVNIAGCQVKGGPLRAGPGQKRLKAHASGAR